MSEVLTVADARLLIDVPDRTDAAVQLAIDNDEAWLASKIGPLVGERTETFWIGGDRDRPLMLRRPTDAVEVLDDDEVVADADVRLLGNGTLVELATGPWEGPSVAVTSTPNDETNVRRVLIDLVRLTLTETGYQSETDGDYQYTAPYSNAGGGLVTRMRTREALAKSLLPTPRLGTLVLRSTLQSARIGQVVTT